MSDKQKELKKLLDGYFPDKKVARARDTLSFAQFIRDETKKEMLGRNNLSDANAKLCKMCRTQTARELFIEFDKILGGVGEWGDNKKYCRLKKKYGVK